MQVPNRKKGGITFLGFNQDNSRFAVGTTDGFQVYCCTTTSDSSKKDEVFQPQHEMRHSEGTSVLGLLYERPLVVHVDTPTPREGSETDGSAAPRCAMRLYNGRKSFEFIDGTQKNFPSPVLAVKLNGNRLIVILAKLIYIYDINDMTPKHVILDTPDNLIGVCALNDRFLAYPGSNVEGKVYVYDTLNLKSVTDLQGIAAHSSAVSCLALSNLHDLMATASQKGTVFRVFAIPTGKRLFEFRRGMATNATIHSMSFSNESDLLAVSSDHQTIHIFKLQTPTTSEPAGWGGYLLGYIPGASQVGELWGQERCFARVDLPVAGGQHLCGFYRPPGPECKNYVIIITSSGHFYKYIVDVEKGGECALINSFSLPPIPPDAPLISHSR